MVIDPPSDNVETGGSRSRWRLAIRRGAPGGVYSLVNTKARGAWRHRKSCQAIVVVVVKIKALGGTCPLPGDLEVATLGGTCPPPGDFAVADWCYTCYDVRDL